MTNQETEAIQFLNLHNAIMLLDSCLTPHSLSNSSDGLCPKCPNNIHMMQTVHYQYSFYFMFYNIMQFIQETLSCCITAGHAGFVHVSAVTETAGCPVWETLSCCITAGHAEFVHVSAVTETAGCSQCRGEGSQDQGLGGWKTLTGTLIIQTDFYLILLPLF